MLKRFSYACDEWIGRMVFLPVVFFRWPTQRGKNTIDRSTRYTIVKNAVLCWLLLAASVFAQQPQQPSGFVPVDQLPASESLPAAPLIITAYAFVWVALFVYLWSIWRRLGKVDADMHALERRLGERTSTR